MKLPINTLPIFLILLGIIGINPYAQAETIVIPLHSETIQGGIDMAEDGDTVYVMPGEYVENINFDGKAITVAGIPNLTTIDGNGEGPCVRFNSEEDALSILLGFTLINGSGVNGRGGGISVEGSTPTIVLNTLTDNSASNGGAIAVVGAGGLVPVNLYRNVIYNNSADNRGGAIYVGALTPAIIMNNTIVYNESGDEGGGVCSDNGLGVFLISNIVAGNISGRGGAIYRNGVLAPPVTVRYCDVWDNEGGNYGRVNAGEGSISEDPLFVDAEAADYFLQEDSPCIDAGDPNGIPDIDGSRADIGALLAVDFPELEPLTGDPEVLDFGAIVVGSDTSLSITVSNPNDRDITGLLQVMAISNNFEPSEVEIIVEAEGDTEVSIIFHPADSGVFEDRLIIITYDEINFGDTLAIPIPVGTTTIYLTGEANNVGVNHSDESIPVSHNIIESYPNPFNSTLNISINSEIRQYGTLFVRDELGRIIVTLFEGELSQGENNFEWKAKELAAGSYTIQYVTEFNISTNRVIYLK